MDAVCERNPWAMARSIHCVRGEGCLELSLGFRTAARSKASDKILSAAKRGVVTVVTKLGARSRLNTSSTTESRRMRIAVRSSRGIAIVLINFSSSRSRGEAVAGVPSPSESFRDGAKEAEQMVDDEWSEVEGNDLHADAARYLARGHKRNCRTRARRHSPLHRVGRRRQSTFSRRPQRCSKGDRTCCQHRCTAGPPRAAARPHREASCPRPV